LKKKRGRKERKQTHLDRKKGQRIVEGKKGHPHLKKKGREEKKESRDCHVSVGENYTKIKSHPKKEYTGGRGPKGGIFCTYIDKDPQSESIKNERKRGGEQTTPKGEKKINKIAGGETRKPKLGGERTKKGAFQRCEEEETEPGNRLVKKR